MKILITIPQGDVKESFITKKGIKELEKLGDISCNPYDRQLSPDELMQMADEKDILITGWGTPLLDKTILSSADKLKIIAHTGGSVGTLVDETAYQKNIKVISGNNVYAKSVAEGCLCYTIAGLRNIDKFVQDVRKGEWRKETFENKGLIGKKVGLVGFGAIAKYFVEMLHLFDTEILVYSSYLSQQEAAEYGVSLSSIDEIFETCDVISLHSSLIPKTQGMVGKELLSKIQDGALLLNTARGRLIDEAALVEELQTGRFSAVLDVFVQEPLALDSPLRTLQNVMPMPHMAGPTIDMRENVVLALAEDIKRYLNGQALMHEIPLDHAIRMTK